MSIFKFGGTMRTVYLVLISTLCFALLITGCSKDDEEAATTSTTSTTSTSSSGTNSEFLSAMPGNLAVSSNTSSGSSVSSSRTLGRTAHAVSDDNDTVSQNDKVTRLQAVLNSTSIDECHKAIPKTMKSAEDKYVDCYGPELAYVNHPNYNGGSGFSGDNSTLPTGDLGIWTAYNDNTTQEACAAGQMNLLMEKTSKKIDLAMGISAMMVCAAKNDNLTLPAVGASALDVTDSLNKTKMDDERGGMSITTATLERDNLTSGDTLWTSSLAGSYTPTGATAQAFSITLKHVPTTDNISTISTVGEGLIQMYQTGLSETDMNCGGSTLSIANSVLYKNTSDNLSYRAIRAKFASTISDASNFYESDGEVRKQNKNLDTTNGWCADYNVVVANVDSSGFGKVSYAWQAGPMDGYTRTFNIKTDNNSADNQTGDAYFGFNPNPDTNNNDDYRSTSIDRMICNWAGPGNGPTSKAGVSKLQRQQLEYDSTNYVWKSSSDNITFAPTTNCNFSTSDNRSYDNLTQSNTTFGGSGDNITSNLESISNYTTNYGSQPSAPTVTLE